MPPFVPLTLLALVVAAIIGHLAVPAVRAWLWKPVAALGAVMLVALWYLGLVWAPPEASMSDVGRILYVHVPTAWADMLLYTACFGFAVAALWTGKATHDAAVEASAEVGVLYNALLGEAVRCGEWAVAAPSSD